MLFLSGSAISTKLCPKAEYELCVCDVFIAKVPLTPNRPHCNFPRNFPSLMENLYSIGIQIPRQRQITILGESRLASRCGMMSVFHYAGRGAATRQLSKNIHKKLDVNQMWKFYTKRIVNGCSLKILRQSNF